MTDILACPSCNRKQNYIRKDGSTRCTRCGFETPPTKSNSFFPQHCYSCEHNWISRLEYPIQCPLCKRNIKRQPITNSAMMQEKATVPAEHETAKP
jgi:uncharacterized protein YbaR (Trm112 family)